MKAFLDFESVTTCELCLYIVSI